MTFDNIETALEEGYAALQAGNLELVEACSHHVLASQPEQPDALHLLALVAFQHGRVDEARTLAQRATHAAPTEPRIWNTLGIAASAADDLAEAADCFTRAVELAPDYPEAWTNLGAVQFRVGQIDEAEASQRQALSLRPGFRDAINNLSILLIARSGWSDMAALMEQIVQQDPQNVRAWVNLGQALRSLERDHEACSAYEHALALTPDDPNPHEQLGMAYQTLGKIEAAIGAFRRCLELDPTRPRVHSELIFALDLHEGAEAAAWEERRRWNARFGRGVDARPIRHPNAPDPDRPLRVGYVSADFHHHSAAFLVRPIIANHDRSKITVVCYSGVVEPDEVTSGFRALADVWHDTANRSDDVLEALIRADQIDILVDLSGHSDGNSLPVFAREPAPVQLTAWGYATGTGLDAMQYFLADPVAVPLEARRAYAEAVVDLPGLFCYEPPDYTPPVAPVPAARRGFVTFGAFNRLEKASPGTRAAWARILTSVPGARLLVTTTRHETDPACQQLVDDLAARGIDRTRVEVRGGDLHPRHMAAHGEIDVLLDTFPHGGGVTTVEALLMGVPVVTLQGDRVAGRVAASCLSTVGLNDLVAHTADEYVAIATRLAADLDRLNAERATLRERLLASPIGDVQAYTRAVEAVYRDLWRRWCRQQSIMPRAPRLVAGRPPRRVPREFRAR